MTARTLIILIVAAAVAALARAQDTLVLRRTARIEPGRPLVLGDVAQLSGPSAQHLAALVLLERPNAEPTDPRGWFRIQLTQVQDLLADHLGESAGMIALSGSACDVRAVAPVERDPNAASPQPITLNAPNARDLATLPTIRGSVTREICRILRTEPTDLRLVFDPADAAFLDLPAAGQLLEISAAGSSERLPIAITRYDASGRADRRTIRVTAELRRPVALAARVITRGSVVDAEDITTEIRWVAPTDQFVRPADAPGSVARRKLDPGALLEAHMIEPPVVVHRGDLVDVRVFCHGMVVARLAHALDDARQGQTIDFAAKDNPRQRLRATVVGKGQAAVSPPPAPVPGAPAAGTAVASRQAAD